MIGRTVAASLLVAQPVIWRALGYEFEAASMIAGLSACLMVRVWVSLKERSATLWAWSLDATVTGLTLLFTAGWILLERPAPFYALLSGAGLGALGAGIIAVSSPRREGRRVYLGTITRIHNSRHVAGADRGKASSDDATRI